MEYVRSVKHLQSYMYIFLLCALYFYYAFILSIRISENSYQYPVQLEVKCSNTIGDFDFQDVRKENT